MDQNTLYTDFWKLLNKSEDYLRYGKISSASSAAELPDFTVPSAEEQASSTVLLKSEVSVLNPENCADCPLVKAGRRAVPALGNPASDLWVVTDPPGLEAEKNAFPLVGDEMDYFSKWMKAIELELPDDLYLQNLVRCRPPGNRPPFSEEMNRCGREIRQRLQAHRPRVILALGPHCASWFSGRRGEKVSAIRGQVYSWEGIPVVVSYSPDQVLSYGELKRPVWEDLKGVRNILNGS